MFQAGKHSGIFGIKLKPEIIHLTREQEKLRKRLALAPVAGVLLFMLLYFLAAQMYPGGSQANRSAVGFSWINNYWCNLLNEQAMNGQPNPARPVAMAGMGVLALTLALFWWLFPRKAALKKWLSLTIQISGALAMLAAFLLNSRLNHDLITNLASLLGAIAAAGTFAGLYKKKWFGLFAFGILNIFLVGLNNYLYYTSGMIVYLPVVQKISFACFLIWICCISVKMYGVGEGQKSPDIKELEIAEVRRDS